MDIENQILVLYNKGFGERRIAKKLGITRGKVISAFKKLNLYNAGRREKNKIYKEELNQKQCNKCLIIKSINDFRFRFSIKQNRSWHLAQCKSCERLINKNLNATKKAKQKRKEYRKNNKEKLNKYNKERWQKDIEYKMRNRISSSIHKHLKNNSIKLGYSINDLKNHLEQQFESWMNWDNWGKYSPNNWNDNDPSTWTWQIDHIIPHSTFQYTSMEDEEFKKCWSLSNLRPYSAKQNCIDGGTKIRHK